MKRSCVWLIAVLVMQITFVLMAQPGPQTGLLTMWDLPYAGAFPGGLALGGNGTVYVTAEGGLEVYRLDPENDIYRSWGVGDSPADVIVIDGVVFCSVRYGNMIVYFNPDGLGTTSAPIPFPHVGPMEIHRGADTASGNIVLWIAEGEVPGIIRFEYNPTADAPGAVGSPSDAPTDRKAMTVEPEKVTADYEKYPYDASHIPEPFPLEGKSTSPPFTEWPLSLGKFRVEDIAVASDGTLWISFGTPILFRFDPVAETLQELETIRNAAIFQGLLPAPDGSIWFGNIVEGAIGHFDPAIGLSEVWRIPGTGEVYDLVFDDDGNIWYTDRTRDVIGMLGTKTGEATIYQLPKDSEPLYLALDEDGAVWFTAGSGNYIGKLETSN